MNFSITLLAIIPFLLLLMLIVVKRMPALKAIGLTWIITVLIAVFVWKVSVINVSASFISGLLTATEIMLIIFGAVWLVEVLKQKKQIKVLQNILSGISPDSRIQAIIIAWFFGSLIEGISGFGVPAALTAPLLVSIGFSPILSVVISLIANSTAVSFGAAGTPILLGLSPLNLEANLLQEIITNTALFHAIAGIIIPIAITYLVLLNTNEKNKIANSIKTLPFIIFAWIAFAVPYYIVAVHVGPEIPSIVAGLFGLILVSIAAHYKFLTPKQTIQIQKLQHKKHSFKKTVRAILPYLIILVLLASTRVFPTIKNRLLSINLSINTILGTDVTYSFLPFYTPSFYFILSVILCLLLYKATKKEVASSLVNAYKKVKIPFITLVFAVALVQIIIMSANNASGLPAIPLLLAESIASITKNTYLVVAPFVGAFGSFIAGSNTVSNLLFGSLQLEAAISLGLSTALVLALQVVGGAAGNLIAIHNVIAANSVVGLKNAEGQVIRKTIVVAILYALLVGVIGLVMHVV